MNFGSDEDVYEDDRSHDKRDEVEAPIVIPSGVVTALPNAPTVPLCIWKPGMVRGVMPEESAGEGPFCAGKPTQKPAENCGCGGELKGSDFGESGSE